MSALEIGVRKDQRQLLATVPRRGVGIAGIFLQNAGYMAEHGVPLRVPVGVVDRLEVVDVEHDQADRVVVAADLLDLGVQKRLEAAVVRKTGQLVRDGLATHLIVELDVLERERCFGSERPKHVEIVVGERAPAARNRDHTVGAIVRFERPERDRGDAHGGGVGLADPAALQRSALRFLHDVLEACQRPLATGLDERLLVAQADAEPTAAALHRVDRRIQRELEQRRAIESSRRRCGRCGESPP